MSKITITGGEYRGRRIADVPGKVRPAPARLRRALFDILGDIGGIAFIDLFAGSGAMGIEALSRGAVPVTFVELEKKHCRAIAGNIIPLGIDNSKYEIICTDAMRWLREFEPAREAIVFAAPPYVQEIVRRVLAIFEENGKNAAERGLILILQLPKRLLSEKTETIATRIHIISDDALLFWQ